MDGLLPLRFRVPLREARLPDDVDYDPVLAWPQIFAGVGTN
jgi:hypothetical protein